MGLTAEGQLVVLILSGLVYLLMGTSVSIWAVGAGRAEGLMDLFIAVMFWPLLLLDELTRGGE